jgi:hypothetical protein
MAEGVKSTVSLRGDISQENSRRFRRGGGQRRGRSIVLSDSSTLQLHTAEQLLSARVADLDESANVSAKHVAEAVQYRSLDRNYWT